MKRWNDAVMRLCNRIGALLDQRNRLVELLLALLVQFGHVDADDDGRHGALQPADEHVTPVVC